MVDTTEATRAAVQDSMREAGVTADDFNPEATAASEAVSEVTDTPAAEEDEAAGTEEPAKGAEAEEAAPEGGGAVDAPAAEDWKPTAEDLDVINKSPELTKVYRSMHRGWTAKTSEVAARQKQLDQAEHVFNTIRKDPVAAVRELAKHVGLEIVEKDPPPPGQAAAAAQTLQAKITESLTAKIGKEAADVLGPVLIEAVGAITEEGLVPIKQALDQQKDNARRMSFRAGINQFGQSVIEEGGDWDEEIEKEMTSRVGTILPGKGATLESYLRVLHNDVMAERSKKAVKGREVTRLQKAVRQAEPVKPVRTTPAGPTQITPGMSIKDATALAISQAKAEAAQRR